MWNKNRLAYLKGSCLAKDICGHKCKEPHYFFGFWEWKYGCVCLLQYILHVFNIVGGGGHYEYFIVKEYLINATDNWLDVTSLINHKDGPQWRGSWDIQMTLPSIGVGQTMTSLDTLVHEWCDRLPGVPVFVSYMCPPPIVSMCSFLW